MSTGITTEPAPTATNENATDGKRLRTALQILTWQQKNIPVLNGDTLIHELQQELNVSPSDNTRKLQKAISDRLAKTPALDQPIKTGRRFTAKRIQQLERLGIITPRDLLLHLPRAHEDRSRITPATDANPNEKQCFQGILTKGVTTYGSKPSLQRGYLVDTSPQRIRDSGIAILWFGQDHLPKTLPPGSAITAYGPVNADYRGTLTLRHPEWDLEPDRYNTGSVVPIYRLTAGISQEWLRQTIALMLAAAQPELERSRPQAGISLYQLLQQVHYPHSIGNAGAARQELAADEILELQAALLHQQKQRKLANPAIPLPVNPDYATTMLDRIPFTPTMAQLRCTQEIRTDLSATDQPPMHRLLSGEVGSGKTLVALHAALDCASAGGATALMAPTETLAEQHYESVRKLLDADLSLLGSAKVSRAYRKGSKSFSIALLTGNVKGKERQGVIGSVKAGMVDLLIGTHALLESEAELPGLKLAIADEQHRFGVNQRGSLQQGAHYLMLTATPIPRTMQLTAYRDIAVSRLDEMPPGRRPVATEIVRTPEERDALPDLIRQEAKAGRQTFIVYPVVKPTDAFPALAASTEFPLWRDERLPDLKVGLAHGQQAAQTRERNLRQFRNGNLDALVATSIIEVGVDVPNATIMIIESAERFGMAQLHQLRGRVGRGSHPGRCLLTITPQSDDEPDAGIGFVAEHRLAAVKACHDGLRLAEQDLQTRGHGEIWGVKQSGVDHLLRVSAGWYNPAMLEQEQQRADRINRQDPELLMTQHQGLLAGRERMLQRMSSISQPANE